MYPFKQQQQQDRSQYEESQGTCLSQSATFRDKAVFRRLPLHITLVTATLLHEILATR